MTEYYETRYTPDPGRTRVWRAIAGYLQRYVDASTACVVDVGAGYCDFINQIAARRKFAVDLNPRSRVHCGPDVAFIEAPCTAFPDVGDASADVIFASNLLEHLDDAELAQTAQEFRRVLKPGGCAIVIQPNFRFAFREYFDDYTHKKIFTDVSLKDFFTANDFDTLALKPRFLPFSLKSRLPKSYLLTRLYLASFIKPMGKQMLGVFRFRGNPRG
jgi:SAM-dependent methyltransferase